MTLSPGTRLGPYEIAGPLGAGGMGEVYRARDTQLKRDVALKVLPADVATDPDRLARFQREAELLAALNHPHIAQIYGLAEADGVRALVMELVEGETLAARIAHGPVPLDEALPLAQQIAEALEFAHERGVIHRDLKPANITLTPDGAVKVLDFGLAKALEPRPATGDPSESPTMTSPAMTQAGIILGTAAYMSPEQARGKPVDKRADIWAFGVVVFEMLAGRGCFTGETVTDVLAAVVKTAPDWTALPADTPSRVRGLLGRCLAKDRSQRLRDIGDARLELEMVMTEDEAAMPAVEAGHAAHPTRSRRETMAWLLVALILLGVIGVVVALQPRSTNLEARPLRLSIVHTDGSEVGMPAISPDGQRIAYRARRADGMPMLWVRALDAFETKPLAGTEDAYFPFWSPDSRQLGFHAGSFLKRIPAEGGPVQNIVASRGARGATWARDGTIVFANGDDGLFQVGLDGGEAKRVVALTSEDWSHYWPSFLPDGRHFLFTAKLWTRSAEASEQGIYLGSLDTPKVRRLLPDLSSAVYARPGYIVFARSGTLMAAPFDLDTESSGEARTLGTAVAFEGSYHLTGVSAASDGTLAIRPPPAAALGTPAASPGVVELRLLDRAGRTLSTSVPDWYASYVALAPDGVRAAAEIADPRTGTNDLWLVHMETGARTRLTTTRGYAGSPVWSGDGARLAYAYQPPGQLDDVYVKDLGTGRDSPLIESAAVWEHPAAWSRDGAYLLVDWQDGAASGLGVWSFASKSLTPFAKGATEKAAFSPDLHYVAFSSVETGRHEVYVTTFPERRQTWAVTNEGGRVISWRRDGRELLVATLSGHIAAYPVSTEGGFTVGTPVILVRDVGIGAPYSCASDDHSRILIRVNPDREKDKGEMRLLFGWTDVLKASVPTGR